MLYKYKEIFKIMNYEYTFAFNASQMEFGKPRDTEGLIAKKLFP